MSSGFQPEIGDYVQLPGGGRAILRYMGPVKNKVGIFAGIELVGKLRHRGKNSGDASGIHYFDTTFPNSGLFLSYRTMLKYYSDAQESVSEPMDESYSLSSPSLSSGGRTRSDSEIEDLRSANRKYEQLISKYETKLAERTKILNDMQSTITNFQPMLSDLDEQMKKRDTKFAKFKKDANSQIEELQETITLLEKQAAKSKQAYSEQLEQLKNSTQDSDNSDNNNKDNNNDAAAVDKLKKQLEAKDEAYNSLKVSKEKEINGLRKFEMDNYKLEMKVEEMGKKIKELQINEGDTNNKKPEAVKEKDTEAQKKIEALEAQVKSLNKEKSELESKVHDLEEKNKKLEEENGELNDKDASLMQNNDELKKKYNELKRNGVLIEKNDDLLHHDEWPNSKSPKKEEKHKSNQIDDISKRSSALSDSVSGYSTDPADTTAPLCLKSPPMNSPLFKPPIAVNQTPDTSLLGQNGELKIYTPKHKADPAAGRKKWCAFCEQEGHDSIDCPYDQGVF